MKTHYRDFLRDLSLSSGILTMVVSILVLGGFLLTEQTFADSSDAVLRAEFIYREAPFRSCHASTLEEVSPGTILAAWFGGTDEGNDDVAIWGARLEGEEWGPVAEFAREEGVPCWNPVLFQVREGETLLFYKAGESPRS